MRRERNPEMVLLSSCAIRRDLRDLIPKIAQKWQLAEGGGYVGQGRVLARAITVLAELEGFTVGPAAQTLAEVPVPKRAKPVKRKRKASAEGNSYARAV